MAALCKFCAKLNTNDKCVFCGNRLLGAPSLNYDPDMLKEDDLVADSYIQDVTSVEQSPTTAQPKKNVLAIVGFVLSLFSAYVMFVGLIISIIGLVKSRSLGGKGKGFAIAGIIISLLTIAAIVVLLGRRL